jgi:hypothetical protein
MGCLHFAGCLLAGALLAPPPAPVPVPTQVALLLKILSADRNLPARSPGGLSIGIVYERVVPASREAAARAAAEIDRENASREGPRVRVGLVDVSDAAALAPGIAALDPGVLYVAPLAHLDVRRISALSRAGKIRTATGVPAFVDAGLAVGFEPGPGGVRILINAGAARAEGADFSSKVLKLARVVP